MSNKSRGSEIEDFVIKKLGLKESENTDYDALQDEVPVEIKSCEMLHNKKNVAKIPGRFSIQPTAHKKLKENSRYIFVVLLEGHPLFFISLSWKIVNTMMGDYNGRRYKLSISKLVYEAEKIAGAMVFLNGTK